MSRFTWLILTLALALPVARPARASIVLAMELPQLTAQAERVVVGEVTSVKSAWDKNHQRILSTIDIQVAEIWKGTMPASGHITLVQPGGVADGIEMKVHGLPYFSPGERAVLFLRGGVGQPPSLVGMGQGKRGMHFEPQSKQWMVDGGDRSAAVRIGPQGRQVPADTEAPLSLDELRRRVKTLVKPR
jgi:hypothetical protein